MSCFSSGTAHWADSSIWVLRSSMAFAVLATEAVNETETGVSELKGMGEESEDVSEVQLEGNSRISSSSG